MIHHVNSPTQLTDLLEAFLGPPIFECDLCQWFMETGCIKEGDCTGFEAEPITG